MLVFIGPSGSGKTSIEKRFHEMGYKSIENYTTRPMREGESDGNPYYFLSREEFFKLKEEGFFAELIEYNGEHYGFAKKDITDDKIASVIPDGFRQLTELKDLNIITFYFEVDPVTRYSRMIQRGDNVDDAKKRITMDKEIFDGIKEECSFIVDATQSLDDMMKDILNKLSMYNKDVYLTTGKNIIHPFAPRMEELDINEIAHALSMNCRYNGHCNKFYSVASHSIAVVKELQRKGYSSEIQLIGLLHDASEAYICDIPRPLKPFLTNYHIIEKNLQDLIYLKFTGGIPCDIDRSIINKVDIDIYYRECELFVDNPFWLDEEGYELDKDVINPEADEPQTAEEKFLEQYNRLVNECNKNKEQ